MELSDIDLSQLVFKLAETEELLEIKGTGQDANIITLTNEIIRNLKKDYRHKKGTPVKIV